MLATIAIGEQYLEPFMKYAYHTWEMYCRRHDLGLILFDQDLISPDHPKWKKATWQKYLIGDVLTKSDLEVNNVCYLDTDILVSPIAPNIFDNLEAGKVGVVSKRRDLPLPVGDVLRRLAFLRHRFYGSEYPLDSSLFISLKDLYLSIQKDEQPNEGCAGVIVFNKSLHSHQFQEFFMDIEAKVVNLTGGGDQTHFNHFVQDKNLAQWLDYRYQALWTYEIATRYPFLYSDHQNNLSLMKQCIEASLFTNYFLHFAGSWHEGKMWEQVKVLDNPETLAMFAAFDDYMKMPVTGKPKGAIKPKDNA